MGPKKYIWIAVAFLSIHSQAFGASLNCPTCNLVNKDPSGISKAVPSSTFNIASFLDRASAPSPSAQLLGQMAPQKLAPQAVAGFGGSPLFEFSGFMAEPAQASSTNWDGVSDLPGQVDIAKVFNPEFQCSFWNSNTGFVDSPMAPWNLVLPPDEASAFFKSALALTGAVSGT